MLVEKRKGISLVNSIIALCVFSMVFLTLVAFQGVHLKARAKEEEVRRGTYILEGVKNIIFCNWNYEDVKETLEGKELYINTYYIKGDKFLENDCKDALTLSKENEFPFVKLSAKSVLDEDVIKIQVNYFFEEGELNCIFYKGNYEEE